MAEIDFVERRHCNKHDEEHYRSCVNADAIAAMEKECKENRTAIYSSLANKTPLWTFIPLILVMLSILGVQWGMYERVSEMNRKMSILEYRYESLFEHKLERK